ncbi:MAG: hypothetical protein JXR69_05015 [Candidatus Delongbacteria bacterium]|nr:hypothetical protein [Candidatus Delongbacteria bacterium]
MNKLKYILLIVYTAVLLNSFSCSENTLESEDKTVKIIEDLSVVPSKVQFGKDRVYHYKVALGSNYLPSDSLRVTAFFTNGTSTVNMEIYDDGISDDSLRNDLAASNNIWSGGINSNTFPEEGNWDFNIEVYIPDSTLIYDYVFQNILVNENSAPVINYVNGIADEDTLFSGFSTKNIAISITDPDNDASGFNDNQTLKLEIRNRDNIPKDMEYVREDPLGTMIIKIDSTLASGLATNDNYNFTFIATDSYGESDSLEIKSIRLENTAPIIYNLIYPDTVFVPIDSTLFIDFKVTVNVNDQQGNLMTEDQDIDSVNITTNSTRLMMDDGEGLDENENDGIYTMPYTMNSSFFPDTVAELPFVIEAVDKVRNRSNLLNGNLVFKKVSKSKTNRESNVQTFNYSNPFNSK